ncbi:MAG: MFS transporter [Nitrososphaerales archaeon]|jgi:EmrB/QacA subfamily drug resistance transporter
MVEATQNPVVSATTKRWILIVATFGSFMGPFDSSVVNLAIPSIGKALGGSIASLSWIITSYLIVITTINLISGRLADIRGRKNTYVIGIGVFVAASALCGFAPSVPALIGTRMIQAVGAGMMSGNAVALISTFYPANERGRALGILTASIYSGLSLGPSAGGFLIQYLGWRSIFYVNVPIGIAVMAIAFFMIRGEMPKGKMEEFDTKGAVVWVAAISLSLLGASTLYSYTYVAIPSLVAGISALAAFVYIESRTEHPLLNLKLLTRNRLFTFTVSTTFLNYASTYGISLVMSLYLRLGLGLSPSYAGLLLLAQPIVMVIASPFGGYLSDRVEPRYQVSAALALMCVAMLSLSTLNLSSTPVDIVLRLAFLGLGYGFFSSANVNAAMSTVTKFQYGVAAGIQNTMRNSGQVISLAVVTAILTATLHENASSTVALISVPPNVIVAGARVSLIILAIINGLGIVLSLSRGKRESSEPMTTGQEAVE